LLAGDRIELPQGGSIFTLIQVRIIV
jgi:hypothetical protein